VAATLATSATDGPRQQHDLGETMSYVRIEKPRPHTSVIVMDRPERMNSMSFELVVPLHEAIAEVAADNDTWCVVLTGVGNAFCAGADTRETSPPPNIEGLTLSRIATRAMTILADLIPSMRRMPQPLICAVNGAAIEMESHTQLFIRMTTQNFEEAQRARKEGRKPDFRD
jgi:enoyl-CoA hydratase/carnithine racemase